MLFVNTRTLVLCSYRDIQEIAFNRVVVEILNEGHYHKFPN